MRRFLELGLAATLGVAAAGCSGEPETILISTGPITEEQAAEARDEQKLVADAERANLAGRHHVPPDPELIRVEQEEKANNAGLAPR